MRYVITIDPKDKDTYIVRHGFIAFILAGCDLSDEIKDYIDRDGYAEVSFKLHFGEKDE